jgi:hypothetical protein
MMRRVVPLSSLLLVGCASRETASTLPEVVETAVQEIGVDDIGYDSGVSPSDVAPWEALCPDDAEPDVAGASCDTTKMYGSSWFLDDAGLPPLGLHCDAIGISLDGTLGEHMDALCAFGTRECVDTTMEDAAPRLQCTVTGRITLDAATRDYVCGLTRLPGVHDVTCKIFK